MEQINNSISNFFFLCPQVALLQNLRGNSEKMSLSLENEGNH